MPMRLDALQVELRPRSGWEAMELGNAMVRRYGRAIWLPWFLVTLPVFALLNWAGWVLEVPPLAWVVMWWLRPIFDRVPLYVLSRAAFGHTPTLGETLRAQLTWGWRPMLGLLTWRRFSPLRAAMMPVDLLEGGDRSQRLDRRRVIGSGVGGHAALLCLACVNFTVLLQVSIGLLVLLFVPNEWAGQFADAIWREITNVPPPWMLLVVNFTDFLAVSLIEPFFMGAGLGLYLNRRTELEAWDIEIAFRRLRQRLLGGGTALLLALSALSPLALAFPATAVQAADEPWQAPKPPATDDDAAQNVPSARADAGRTGDTANAPQTGDGVATGAPADGMPADGAPAADTPDPTPERNPDTNGDGTVDAQETAAEAARVAAEAAVEDEEPPTPLVTLTDVFGERAEDQGRDFNQAVKRAYEDPQLSPKRTVTQWVPIEEDEQTRIGGPDLTWIGDIFAFIAEYGLWILFAVLVLVLIATSKRWFPWLASGLRSVPQEAPAVASEALPPPEALPPDIAAAARRLWQAGEARRALALLYRASVAAMAVRVGAHLPPGATEAECLRIARRMPEAEDRSAFQRVVSVWQYAAYGQRLPDGDDFERLVDTLALRFGWRGA
jgi:hypothetical protein